VSYKKFLYIFVFFLLAILLSQGVLAEKSQKELLRASFLNVGQGDAALIDYLGDYQILIDGGPNGNKLISEISKEISPLDKKIEVVILTHPDKDHYQGLVDLLDKYEVGLFLYNGTEDDAESYKQLENELGNKKIETKVVTEGSTLAIGENLKMEFFNPDEVLEDNKEKNSSSIVIRLDFGENSFLFTGDAEFETENDMISDEEDLDVDFLKVGHHGSKNASGAEFLQKVSPRYSIISVGQNSYGHPTEETLGRLKAVGSEVIRTDEQGIINVVCDNPKADCFFK
jgi:competence protein ComEC